MLDCILRKHWSVKRTLLCGFLVASTAWPTSVSAGDVQDCFNVELIRGDPYRAVAACRLLADQGDVRGQHMLGLAYEGGVGGPQDFVEAAKWFRKAADQGDASSQCRLGFMYREGQGVPKDFAEALKWYRKAADQGDDWAQANLGSMYAAGEGVPKDYATALEWFRKAADQGNYWGQRILGLGYLNGVGVPQDYVLAHMWFTLAVASGSEEAKKQRDQAAKKMTREQIAEAQRLAQEWEPSASSN